jgi:glycosyltransferase involved in cell wall biosynthesis
VTKTTLPVQELMPTRDQSPPSWHILASEYPPQIGGVSGHTFVMATAFAERGDAVHVWCTPASGETPERHGVVVHRTFGSFTFADLRATGHALDEYPAPRRLIVQWVPHGFGWRGMNVAFCAWLWSRARRGDRIELIVHEPFMPMDGPIKHVPLGLAQRAMAAILLRAASSVWVTTPAWIDRLRPYSPFRMLALRWIPVPSTVPVTADGQAARQLRERFAESDLCLVGHFGFGGGQAVELLAAGLRAIAGHAGAHLVLIGRGSENLRTDLLSRVPHAAERLHVTGDLSPKDVSAWLSACDFLLQPYPDGVTTRRTTTVTALAHGIPVLTTSGPLSEAMWGESAAVALSPVGNPEGFALATKRLLKSAAERTRLKFAGRALYRARFDINRMIDQLRSPDPSI